MTPGLSGLKLTAGDQHARTICVKTHRSYAFSIVIGPDMLWIGATERFQPSPNMITAPPHHKSLRLHYLEIHASGFPARQHAANACLKTQ